MAQLSGKWQPPATMSADSVSHAPDGKGGHLGSVHHYRVLIVEGHLDTFGHVNNATYLQLFEEARWDLITSGGYGMEVIRETRQGPVVLEAEVKFRAELKNRENVTIETSLLSYRKKVGKLRQVIQKDDGSPACEAVFTIALWDIDARKLLFPTERWLAAVGVDLTQVELS